MQKTHSLPLLCLLTLGVLGLSASCGDPTQATLTVRTNVPYRAGISVGIWTSTSGRFAPGAPAQSTTQDPWLEDGALGDLVVSPSQRKDEPLTVRVIMGIGRDPTTCTDADATGCIVAKRRLAFVPNKRLRVPVVLHLACQGVVCDDDSTCNYLGACAPAAVNADACERPEGCVLEGDETVTGITLDAGPADASAPETAAPIDAATDSAPPDAGPPEFCTGALLSNAPYAAGTGSAQDPFVLCTGAQLRQLSQRPGDWASSFRLARSIDLTGTGNLAPIGTNPPFSGRFDGGGNTLSGLNLSTATTNNLGLFATLSGTVEHLRLQSVTVVGTNYVGALVGTNGGSITDVRVTGGTVSGNTYVGGLVGSNGSAGTITNGRSSVAVSSTGIAAGGLTGLSNGVVAKCSATGPVSTNIAAGCSYTGGLIGFAGDTSRTQQSFATGAVVSSGASVGGLAGWGRGLIEDSYARGSATGGPAGGGSCAVDANQVFVGGLVGAHVFGTGILRNTYATGAVSATTGIWAGGLTGLSFNGCALSNSFSTGTVAGAGVFGGVTGENNACSATLIHWDLTRSGIAVGGGTNSQANLTGINTSGGNGAYFFTATNPPLSSWDFANTWSAVPMDFPKLRWELTDP
jgi:hypothetical protein